MDRNPPQHKSQLFTVRLWTEELDDRQLEWRGRVQHVDSGEVRYFSNWPALIALLHKMAGSLDANAGTANK